MYVPYNIKNVYSDNKTVVFLDYVPNIRSILLISYPIKMTRGCAFGCQPPIHPMHRFPKYDKFPGRFKEWVALCGGKLDTTLDYEFYQIKRVCNKHFTEKDHNRCNRLNALAVPSVHLPRSTSASPVEILYMEDRNKLVST